MHEPGAAGYRRLNRNSFAGFAPTRNVSLFVVLIGLVVFLGLFYLYMSASSDLQELRQEYNNQADYLLKLKNELLDFNVKMETLRTSENTCQSAKASLNSKHQEFLSEISLKKSTIENLERSTRDKETELQNLQNELNEARKLAKKLEGELEGLKQQNTTERDAVLTTQKNIIEILTKDIAQKDEMIAQLKTSSPPNPVVSNSSTTPTSLSALAMTPVEGAVKPKVDSKDLLPRPPPVPLQAVGAAPPVQSAAFKNASSTTTTTTKIAAAVAAPKKAGEEAAGDISPKEAEADSAADSKNNNNGVNAEIRSGQGEFLAERQAGGRVKLEEVNQAKQEVAMDAPLLKAAQDTANNGAEKNTDEHAEEAVPADVQAKQNSNEAEDLDDQNL